MGAQAVAISEPAGLPSALAAPGDAPIVLAAATPIGAWFAPAVAEVRTAGRALRVEVVDPGDAGDARSGREVGAVLALLEAGVAPTEIVGVDPRRIARVVEVVRCWQGGGATR